MVDTQVALDRVYEIAALRREQDKNYEMRKRIMDAIGQTKKEQKVPDRVIPDYYPGYRLSVMWLEQIKAHAEKGFFPEWLFENNSPNMTEREAEYVESTFKQDTLEVFKDYIDTMGRGYHTTNYKIEFQAEPDQYIKAGITYRDYITKDLPVHGSLEVYNFEYLPPLKGMDGWGVNVVLPGDLPVIEDAEGGTVIDPERMLSPYPEFFHTTKVVEFNTEYVIIESQEKSEVEFNGKTVREGMVYWVIDNTWYRKGVQYGKKIDNTYRMDDVYEHGLGYIPAIRVGGNSIKIHDVNMEMSPFLYAVDTLDRVLIDAALLAGVKANCTYPYRVMYGNICKATMLSPGGEILHCQDGAFTWGEGSVACKECYGTGLEDRITPTGVMLLNPSNNLLGQDGDRISASNALFYASPSTETQTFLRQEIDYNLNKAYNMLHIKRDNSATQKGDAVTAMEIRTENKNLIASVVSFAEQLFYIFKFNAKTLRLIRYGDAVEEANIIEPANFDFYTTEELLQQIAGIVASNQPAIVIQSSIRDLISKIYFKDPSQQRIFELISKTDRLFAMTKDEVDRKQTKRLVHNWEVVLHDSAMTFIDELIEEDPRFWDKTFTEQKAALIRKAQAFATAIAAPVTTVQPAPDRLATILNGLPN